MKNKENNQEYQVPILVLIAVINLVLIVCYLVIDALIGFKNIKEVIPIIISIFGLFATFGGAYLGAKIAGQISRDNMIDELQINREIELERMNLEYHLNQLRYLHEKTTILYFNINKMEDFIYEIIFDVFQNKAISDKNLDFIAEEFEKISESIKVINNELIFLGTLSTIDIGSENYIDISRSIRRGNDFNIEYLKEAFCNCNIELKEGHLSMSNIYSFTGKEVSGILMLLSEERQNILKKIKVN